VPAAEPVSDKDLARFKSTTCSALGTKRVYRPARAGLEPMIAGTVKMLVFPVVSGPKRQNVAPSGIPR